MAPKRAASSSPSASFASDADRVPVAPASPSAAAADAENSNPNPDAGASPIHNPDSSPLAPASATGAAVEVEAEVAAADQSDADSNPPKPSHSFSVSVSDAVPDDADADADPDEVSSDGVPPSRPRRAAELSVMPISTRPMDSDAAATPLRSSKPRMKRPRTNLALLASEPRRPQRVWSTEDEIAILQGLVNYRSQRRGALPSSALDMSVLHSNIRHKLGTKATTSQLSDKVRRLKQKYTSLASRVKREHNASFPSSHEQSLYDLGKKIWGGKKTNGGVSSAAAAAVVEAENNLDSEREENVDSEREAEERKSRKSRKIRAVVPNGHQVEYHEREGYAPYAEDNAKQAYPYLWETVEEIAKENTSLALFTRAFEVLEGSKARAMEDKLRKFRMTEARQHLRRMDLMKETAKMVVDALERTD